MKIETPIYIINVKQRKSLDNQSYPWYVSIEIAKDYQMQAQEIDCLIADLKAARARQPS